MVESSQVKKSGSIDTDSLIAARPDPFGTIIWNAIYENATDVHFNNIEEGMLVLYRVDGIIHEKQVLPAAEGKKLLNQIKAASSMDATKCFMPQEGQIKWPDEEMRRDIRVTIVPAGRKAESAHLRILSFPKEAWQISKLGFSEKDLKDITTSINSLGGLVLISGVTGSGKTSTMYSFASLVDLRANIAFSIEDPIEFDLPYAQQIEVDERHGLTMYEGLQTILRTDPDLVLIGEIRDKDSAAVAARAALSGRLVLATIHARDAAGTVDSLHYLGVPYHIIGGSIKLIVSQNLMRTLCPSCAQERKPTAEEKALFKSSGLDVPKKLYNAAGCEDCEFYGYKGRIAIFEVAIINPDTAHLIADGIHQKQLRDHFRNNNINSMLVDGLKKVAQGMTSMDELYRVCDFRTET